MIGIVLDLVLILLLVGAVAYGIRLEKKLVALRAGQLAFAGAVTELNAAAGRAEAALSSLRASGEEADILHDRLMKAREVKGQLETLMARAGDFSLPRSGEGRSRSDPGGDVSRPSDASPAPTRTAAPSSLPMKGRETTAALDDDRSRRMQALAARIQGMASPSAQPAPEPGRERVAAILGALNADRGANHAAKRSLNEARRTLDDDLFAA